MIDERTAASKPLMDAERAEAFLKGYKNSLPLYEGERIDDLQRNGYGIIQKAGGFCFGMDAVLLSGFARARKSDVAVDLGTGTGIIPLLLYAKTGASRIYGLEIQEEVADMAERSVRLNGLSEHISVIRGDIKDPAALPEELYGRTDVVTANPPYMKKGSGLINPGDMKSISRHELTCDIGDVCRTASRLLRPGGHFYMVHRPLRLSEIIKELCAAGVEPKRLKFVHPYADHEANMVLIDGVKGARVECRVEKPLIVYEEKGRYTKEIYEIYGY